MEHPAPEVLQRFADLTAPRTASRGVVRHLLHGCATCAATIRKRFAPEAQPGAYDEAIERFIRAAGVRTREPEKTGARRIYGHFLVRFPATLFLLVAGVAPRSARALLAAGISSLPDLEIATKKDLLSIQGVGTATVARIEELLGWPLPENSKSLKIARRQPPQAQERSGDSRRLLPAQWRALGFRWPAAEGLAAQGMSLEKLATLTREELLAIPGAGPGAVYHCEQLLEKPFPPVKEHNPALAYWTRRGISGRAAKSLLRMSILTVEDLRRRGREELLGLRGVGEKTLARMEKILRTKLPTGGADFWKRQGLAAVIAHALHRAGIHTIEGLAAVTREEFLSFNGLAHGALERCEALLGRPFASARRRWMEMGLPPLTSWKLSRSRILTLDDLARSSPPDLEELGFKRPEIHLLDSLLRSRRRS